MIKQNLSTKSFSQRSCSLDYLRAAIILLALFLHSILSYVPWAKFELADYTRSTAPIVDTNTSLVFDLLPPLINGFFMELMFFISGLFVWKSLVNKGSAFFLTDRLRRLGIPFLVMVGVIMPTHIIRLFSRPGQRKALSRIGLAGHGSADLPGIFLCCSSSICSQLFAFNLLGIQNEACFRILFLNPAPFL